MSATLLRRQANVHHEVLAVPEADGFDLAGAIFIGLRRWRREGGGRDGGSAEPPEPGLDPDESKRLDADLARYKL